MVDERLLAPIRRFWSEEEVGTAYQRIFAAYSSRLDSVTVIVAKASESESAQGQVVVNATDYLQWMEALEFRLQELADETAELAPIATPEHVHFGRRYTRT